MRLAWLIFALSTPAFADTIDGHEVKLDKAGALVVGDATANVSYDDPDGAAHTRIEVISLGGKRRAAYLVTDRTTGEDPPDRHQIFLYDKGELRLVYDKPVYAKRIAFTKAGTGRYVDDAWSACTLASKKAKKHVKMAPVQNVTLTLDAKAMKLVEKRTPGKARVNCDELSACPFVYEIVGGQPRFAGEILRNIRYRPALQALWIGDGAGATIRITEEKPEVTFLDEIYLEVDGVRVAPASCIADPTLAYCAADGRYHVMTTGAELPLVFEARAGKRALFARGYYTPDDVADRNEATLP